MKFRTALSLIRSLCIPPCLAALLIICTPAPSSAGGGLEKVPTEDPVLDRNGDGYQDVIVKRNKVHYDIDFDGRFDYTLSLHLPEYSTDAHTRYIAGGFDPKVFGEITMECLDKLCATDRDEAFWYEKNFGTFSYYNGWYTRLYIFSDSPLNDGRLTSKKHRGQYEYWITFNPDGTVKTAKKGVQKLSLAEFDYENNTSSGKKITLPEIKSLEDLGRLQSEIDSLFQ